jgi:hypothetical protein
MTHQMLFFPFFVVVGVACTWGGIGASVAWVEERPGWNDVPLSKVYPYPSKEERAGRNGAGHRHVRSRGRGAYRVPATFSHRRASSSTHGLIGLRPGTSPDYS